MPADDAVPALLWRRVRQRRPPRPGAL